MNCEYCGYQISGNQTECPACGAKFSVATEVSGIAKSVSSTTICKQCGEMNVAGCRFCKKCGAALKDGYVCVKCGKRFDDQNGFCDSCGGLVTAAENISPCKYSKYLLLSYFLGAFGGQFFYSKRRIIATIVLILSLAIIALDVYFLLDATSQTGYKTYTTILGETTTYYFNGFRYWLRNYWGFAVAFFAIWITNIILAFKIKTDANGSKML